MPDHLLLYILIASGFILIPGPNVLVIVSTTLTHGRTRGLQTVLGTSMAMAVQLLVAAITTLSVITVINQGFLFLKWFGVGYLIYLAIRELWGALKNTIPKSISGFGSFKIGFFTSLSNPKTIFFFGAFLPQFVSDASNYFLQITMLSLIFWCLAIFIDTGFALLSSKLTDLISLRPMARIQKGVNGLIMLVAGLWLATIKSE